MVGAVIITHGRLAEVLLEVAQSITGKAEGIETISLAGSDNTDAIRQSLASAAKSVNSGNGVVIFTDMFGGTPTNIALSLLEEGKVEVITGINLPMLFKFISHRVDKPIHELAVLLRDYGQKSIVLAAGMLKEKK